MRLFLILFVFTTTLLSISGQDIIALNHELETCQQVGDCHEGFIRMKKNGSWFYYDVKKGKIVFGPYAEARDFNEGFAWVRILGTWHILNPYGVLKETPYDRVTSFHENMALVVQDKKKLFCDTLGHTCLSDVFDDAKSFEEGLAAAKQGSKWGFIDKEGKWVIPPRFIDVHSFHEGYAAVDYDHNWMYITPEGHLLMNQKFKYATDFHKGRAIVKPDLGNKSYILQKDTSFIYLPIGIIQSFSNDVAVFKTTDIITVDSLGIEFSMNQYGYLKYDSLFHSLVNNRSTTYSIDNMSISEQEENSQYYPIVAPSFDYALPFSEGAGAICKDKKWGYVDEESRYLTEMTYDAAYPFREGLGRVEKDGRSFFLSSKALFQQRQVTSRSDEDIFLQLQTIASCYQSCQYDRAIMGARQLAGDLLLTFQLNGGLSESQVNYLIQSTYINNYAVSHILSKTVTHNPAIWHHYKQLTLPMGLSAQFRSPILAESNGLPIIRSLTQRYPDNENIARVVSLSEMHRHREAQILFDRYLSETNTATDESNFNLLVRYYLSLLSYELEGSDLILAQFSTVSPSFIDSLPPLEAAILYTDLFQTGKAEFFFSRSKDCAKKFHSQGLLYLRISEKDKALECFRKAYYLYSKEEDISAMELRTECLSKMLELTAGNELLDLSRQYIDEELSLCARSFERYNSYIFHHIWSNALLRLGGVITLLATSHNKSNIQTAYQLTVFRNGFIHKAQEQLNTLLRECEDEELRKLYSQYTTLRATHPGVDLFRIRDREESETLVHDSIIELESRIHDYLASHIGSFIDTSSFNKAPKRLPPHNHAIEVISLMNEKSDMTNYAFVQSYDHEDILFIPIRTYPSDSIEAIHYQTYDDEQERKDMRRGIPFWQSILKNMRIDESDTLYINFGQLGDICWEYKYFDHSDEPIYFKFQIHRVESTGNIDKLIKRKAAYTSLALFGDLEYGMKTQSTERGAKNIGSLKYTEKEIDEIYSITHEFFDVTTYKKADGTTRQFMKMSGSSPSIIHIATHGYFNIPISEGDSFQNMDKYTYFAQDKEFEDEDYLLHNSGLLMSHGEGGTILYSNAIAQCDLSNSHLAILSACSTINGRASHNHHVTLGLNQAFHLAGVENIISSMWDVDDQKACEMMILFYRHFTSLRDVYKAFRKTVIDMYGKYHDFPEYWGAFTLTESD